MKALLRTVIALLGLLALHFFFQPANAQELVVEDGNILSTMVIRGQDDDAFARQEIVRMESVAEMNYSPFEVDTVGYEFAENGFILAIDPVYSTELKTTQTQYHVYIFIPTDKQMNLYLEKGEEVFLDEILEDHEVSIRVVLKKEKIYGKDTPVLLIVKTIALEIST